MRNIELNGPANIVTFLENYYEQGDITHEIYVSLKEQAEFTMHYLLKLDNPDEVQWSDVLEDRRNK